ncbi:MAG: ROK family transcriptional regulator [Sphaerochaetaceae bacterium]|nr:ROK family transcriptional regulator [Sphaerochaetaceae bacterium]
MKIKLQDSLINYKNVFSLIEEIPSITRATLAKRLGLSKTTISLIVSNLLNSNLISEAKANIDGRGRPAVPLYIDSTYWHSLGIGFMNNHWDFIVTNLNGKVVYNYIQEINGDDVFEKLFEGIKIAVDDCHCRLLPKIGLGVPGIVNTKSGIIIQAADQGWKDIPLKKIIKEKTGWDSIIMNRHKTSGLAEYKFSNMKDFENCVFIGISSGISAAIISNGKLIQGEDYAAGELGHCIVNPKGRLCKCGKRGCLQTEVSTERLMEKVEKAYYDQIKEGKSLKDDVIWKAIEENNLTMELIWSQEERDNPIIIESLSEMARNLSYVMISLINIVNPKHLIIGGTLGCSSKYFCFLLQKEIMKIPFSFRVLPDFIVKATLNNQAAALGAALLPVNEILGLILKRN